MSRSRKKYPLKKDKGWVTKKLSNRIVRRNHKMALDKAVRDDTLEDLTFERRHGLVDQWSFCDWIMDYSRFPDYYDLTSYKYYMK